jgi:hypothetical protein
MMQKWNRIVIFRKGIRYCTLHIDGVSDTIQMSNGFLSTQKIKTNIERWYLHSYFLL